MNWRALAGCLDEDPELFFPVGEGERYSAQIEVARRICAGCSVASQCLDYAVATDQFAGVWGGTLPHERAAPSSRDPLPCAPALRS